MGECGPSEVLVSRVVTELVAGAGLKFSERGSHEFKGLAGRWDLFRRQFGLLALAPPRRAWVEGSETTRRAACSILSCEVILHPVGTIPHHVVGNVQIAADGVLSGAPNSLIGLSPFPRRPCREHNRQRPTAVMMAEQFLVACR
jgi:hypothetical protein